MSQKTPSSKATFSSRQLQILDLIAQGKSNKEIAEELKITYGTVKQHLFTIFRMLGVTSRGKVAIVARRILEAHQYEYSKKNGHVMKHGYSWRLISAAAFLSADISMANPDAVISHALQLQELRQYVSRLTQSLDGKSMPLPNGGMLVWFGHPIAHLDDADRACQLAKCVQHFLKQQQNTTLRIGFGLASHVEVAPAGSQDLISAEVYRDAMLLAQKSLRIGLPLANPLIQQLAPNSVPWLQVIPKQTTEAPKENGRLPGYIAVGGPDHALTSTALKWGGLPFLKEILASAESGIAQWLAVESWPPSVATALIDAIGNESVIHGFKAIHIRLPVQKQGDMVSSYLLAQIEAQPSISSDALKKSFTGSNSERLAYVLAHAAEISPIVLQVYGIQALESLKEILGDKGIDRLVGSRLIVVAGNLRDQGEAQTSVRLLGPRPNKPLFSRVLSMEVPELNLLPEGIRIDLQALLDQLSPVASALILNAASSQDKSIEDLVLEVKAPRPVIQSAIQELASMGLIMPSHGAGFEFRDIATANAIKQLGDLSQAA